MTPQPGQPDQPQYLISELNLFPVYTSRAAYQQVTGQQAPPFNPALPIKQWADPSPTGQPYIYFDSTNAAGGYLSQFALPAAQAGSLNLPGVYTYPAYVAPPTCAQVYGPTGLVGGVSADQLSLLTDAQEILSEILALLPGQRLVVGLLNYGPYYYVYGTEQRRPWTILPVTGWTATGIQLNCQTLIEMKDSHGIGAPGHWALLNGSPNWVYDPPTMYNVPLCTLTRPPSGTSWPASPIWPDGSVRPSKPMRLSGPPRPATPRRSP